MINLLLVQLVNTDMSGSVESKTFFEKMNDGLFGNIAEFISNCLVYWPFCVFVLVMLVFLFTFKKRTKGYLGYMGYTSSDEGTLTSFFTTDSFEIDNNDIYVYARSCMW